MTLDETIAHLQQLRLTHGGDTPVVNEDDVAFEVAEFNDDDGAAIVLLFENVSF